MRKTLVLCKVALGINCLATLSAQAPVLMGAGYAAPTPMLVSPGQIITLYVSGTKTVLPPQSASIQATKLPLPNTLGGFSVTVQQGNNTYAAPLVSVAQSPNCQGAGTSSPECIITALTVQIPFEIAASVIPQTGQLPPSNLGVNDNGTPSSYFPIEPLIDNVHLLTACDAKTGFPFIPSPCPALVAHADGTVVSNASPATAGETVVLYAYGLGLTTPAVRSGEATPAPAPVLVNRAGIGVQFDFRPNARASIPYITPSSVTDPSPILFAGLAPGQVGLYQINVKIPDAVPYVPACTLYFSCLDSLIGCFVQSNLTIDIAGLSSFDGAAICVQPPVDLALASGSSTRAWVEGLSTPPPGRALEIGR